MPTAPLNTSSAAQLAQCLEQDIRHRGLVAGDRYLSTREVGRRFGVNLGVAALAMQLLTDRGALVRRDRSGTFVGGEAPAVGPQVRVIHVLTPVSRARQSQVPAGELLKALQATHPGASVQFSVIPDESEPAYLRELLGEGDRREQLAGVVAMSCSRRVYRYLLDLGAPTVVLGTPDADLQALPSVDVDHAQAGRLLASELIRGGHRQLALLSGGAERPGDHALLDGLMEAIGEAGLPATALAVRLCPSSQELFRLEAQALLEKPDRPTAFICRGAASLKAVVAAAQGLGLTVPGDVEVAFQTLGQVADTAHLHVQTAVPFERIAEQISQMLHRVGEGQPLESPHVVIPVELCVPGEGNG